MVTVGLLVSITPNDQNRHFVREGHTYLYTYTAVSVWGWMEDRRSGSEVGGGFVVMLGGRDTVSRGDHWAQRDRPRQGARRPGVTVVTGRALCGC